MIRSIRTSLLRASLLASLLCALGALVHADDPVPQGATEGPILTVSICANGEVCGTAWDHNPPIEIIVERVGESGELETDTETNGNTVSYETTSTSGDDEGETYRVTATDKYGNSTVKYVIR